MLVHIQQRTSQSDELDSTTQASPSIRISRSYRLTIVIGMVEVQQKQLCTVELFWFWFMSSDDDVDSSTRLLLLRYRATQDTDKPEIQPMSEPESLHSCVLSWE